MVLGFGGRALRGTQIRLEGKATEGSGGEGRGGGARKGTEEDGVAERSELRRGGRGGIGRKRKRRYEGKVDEGAMRGDKDRARRGSSRGSSAVSAGDSRRSSRLSARSPHLSN